MLPYLRLILPVYVQVTLEALQGQTQTSPPTLGGRFYDLFPSLTVLSQTLAFSETHFGLKETEEETILMCVNSWLTGWQVSKRMTGGVYFTMSFWETLLYIENFSEASLEASLPSAFWELEGLEKLGLWSSTSLRDSLWLESGRQKINKHAYKNLYHQKNKTMWSV